MVTLGEKIKAAAYLEGEFILRSGQTSKYYLDKYLFETNYEILGDLSDAFAKKILKEYPDVDLLAAPELGAVAIVAAVSPKVKKDFVIVRKEQKDYGTSKRIEGRIKGTEKILILEDILTTGGAAIHAAKVLRQAGYQVVGILGTVDRLQGAQAAIEAEDLRYDTLLTKNDLGI
jgi:orotate phosphoribosyltransferase